MRRTGFIMAAVLLFAASAHGGSLSCCGGSTDAGSTGGGTTVPEVEQHSHSFFAHPAGLGPGDQYHILFATSNLTRVTGDTSVPPPSPTEFGGIAAADWDVTYHAAFAGLVPGWNGLDLVYRSILSIDGDNAVDRLSIVGPVYNTNGDLLANDAADLWDGSLANPVGYDEKGILIASNTQVWTGTLIIGTWSSGQSCGDWDIPLSTEFGRQGNATLSNNQWIYGGLNSCNNTARLYGLSPAITVPEPSTLFLTALGLLSVAGTLRVPFASLPSARSLATAHGVCLLLVVCRPPVRWQSRSTLSNVRIAGYDNSGDDYVVPGHGTRSVPATIR